LEIARGHEKRLKMIEVPMKDKNNRPGRVAEQRRQAEEIVRRKAFQARENQEILSPEATQQLHYELQVHQIELEMQNDELRRTHVDLEVLRARYFDLYDLAPVGYVRLSEKGMILEANMTFATLVGMEREKLFKQSITRFILREDQDVYYRYCRQSFEPEKSKSCDLRMEKIGGIVFWAQLTTTTSREEDDPSVFRMVIVDISERKAMEEELKKAHDEMEARVQERTVELTTTLANLKKANRQMEEFVFIASHDLQEPLRKIETFTTKVGVNCSPILDLKNQDYLNRAIISTRRMRQLLNDLLKLSRAGTKIEDYKRIDLRKTAMEAAYIFESADQKIEVQVQVEEMPAIEADESQIRQLFQNLIGNALKFCSKKTPFVQVHGRSTEKGFLEVFVEDNGIGFDSNYSEIIFKPFGRLHGRNEYEGAGMGLAICRKIVERHGGTIRAESELGKGSTFIIKLPLRQTGMKG
jgi:PAS domain S-box-containing protein